MLTQTAPPKPKTTFPLAWVLLVLLALIWGSSFILIKKVLVVYSPLQTGSLRIFLAGLVCWVLIAFQWRKMPWQVLKWAAIGGIVGNLLPSWLFSLAGSHLDSSVSGILNATTPLFTFLVGWLLFNRKSSPAKMLGIFIGLLGCVLLVLVNAKGGFSFNVFALLPLAGTLLYGFHFNFYKTFLNEAPPIPAALLVMGTAGIPAGMVLFSTDFMARTAENNLSGTALGYVAILAVVSSVIGTMLSNKLNQLASPLMVSSVTYLMPVVSVGWGMLDGETINAWQVLGMLVIILGVFVVNRLK